jgi:hypothetical protein
MKIFYFSDESFLDMKNHFESSFKEDLEKQFTYLENINIDRTKPGSGKDIWKFKTEMVVDAIKANKGDVILISDIDIVFYKPVLPVVLECMNGYEMCFQKETVNHGINIGFISIRCNDNTLTFWSKVYEVLCNSNRWDQEIVNDLLYNEKYDIQWNLFPHCIWNWSQGNPNRDIVLHHANCTSTKEGKYQQMRVIANKFSQ